MAIIYSYPLVTALEPKDTFIISKTIEAENRIETNSIKFEDLQKSITDRFINPDATDFKIPVFNQGGNRITGSILQDTNPVASLYVPIWSKQIQYTWVIYFS